MICYVTQLTTGKECALVGWTNDLRDPAIIIVDGRFQFSPLEDIKFSRWP